MRTVLSARIVSKRQRKTTSGIATVSVLGDLIRSRYTPNPSVLCPLNWLMIVWEDRIESIAVTDLAGDSTTIPQLLLCANGLMSNRVLLLEQESL